MVETVCPGQMEGNVVDEDGPGVGHDLPDVGTKRFPCPLQKSRTTKNTPLPTQHKTLRKCQCRAMLTVCRYPGRPIQGER